MILPPKSDSNRYAVYVIQCRVTGEKYVGRTSQRLTTRLARHQRHAELGERGRLYDAIRKHGIDSFECIGWLSLGSTQRSKPVLRSLETMMIERVKPELNVGYQESSRKAGRSGNHVRYHVNRGIQKEDCKLCYPISAQQ